MWEIFRSFLLLGMSSFGGPAAHMGYFYRVFVSEKKWLGNSQYSTLVALCQFLPGPASSQLGFAIGYHRGGLAGAIAAFAGFTLPSFLLMWALAVFAAGSAVAAHWEQVIHGLKLLAVIVVADAVLGMYRNFCRNQVSRWLCFLSAMLLLVYPGIGMQLFIIVGSGFAGWLFANSGWNTPEDHLSRTAGSSTSKLTGAALLCLMCFVTLMVVLPMMALFSPTLSLASDFYLAGSWVFGGGHVVLPLLQGLLADSVDPGQFLTGYAAAQAVPGPMFTLATFLGAILLPENTLWGALVATIAVFLPGFLLVLGLQKVWLEVSGRAGLRAVVMGINAGVVGLLASALYAPVFVTAVYNGRDLAIVLAGFFLLRVAGLPVLWLVAGITCFSLLSSLI